jgi:hypothetical protein
MASPIVRPIGRTEFQPDKAIVAPGRSLTADIDASADHDVLDAILENKFFPRRPQGKIETSRAIDPYLNTQRLQAAPNILTFRNNSRVRFELLHRVRDAAEGTARDGKDTTGSVRLKRLKSGKPAGQHLQDKSMEVQQC